MIRLLAPALLIVCLLSACTRNDKSFKVLGEVSNLPVQEVRLIALGIDDKLVVVDSSTSDDKGRFELHGESDEPSIYQLRFERAPADFLLLSLQNGTTKIAGSWPGLPENYTVAGSDASSSLRSFLQVVRSHVTDINSIMAVTDTLRAHGSDSMLQNAEVEMTALKQNLTHFIESYADTTKYEANALFTIRWLNPVAEEPFINTFSAGLERRFPGSVTGKRFTERFRQTMDARAKAAGVPQPRGPGGEMAKEISMPTPEGKIVTLTAMRGKWVLLDFWAAWCGPCRAENPNVVAAYEKFKGKNFTVFGVSLDDDKDKWVKAIQADKLAWTHVSDLKRWENVAARDYEVEGIPANFLIDPSGAIVARDLRGPALEAKLAEVLK